MKSLFLISAVVACLVMSVSAQQLTPTTPHRTCGTMQHHQQLLNANPGLAAKMAAVEAHTQQNLNSGTHHGGPNVYTIPVVVHVVYNTPVQNISAAQVQSQIDVLNEDFRRNNANASQTLAAFQGVAADCEMEFCLATQDPQGNPHSGITRTSTSVTAFNTNDAVKFTASGGQDIWAPSQYLNIWVCNLAGLLGYAQLPGGPSATDGVVIDFQYFGRVGTATPPFNLGRTATHEVGHHFNLRHLWGTGGCGSTDFVADTPTSDAPNYGCPLNHTSCGSLDMVQNFMDYTDDSCMNLFTAGQKARMRALFNPGGARASLLNSPACGPQQPQVAEWQINQIYASMNFDGTTGTQYVPAVTQKCVGDPGTLTLFSLDNGGQFNVGFMVRALYPMSAAQSYETAGGQILHIDLADPSTTYWGGSPAFVPYIGNQTIPYTALAAVQFSAQMAKVHPSSSDGFYLSAGGQLDITSGTAGTPTPLVLGDDDSVSFTAPSAVSFYGTTTSTVHVNSNGSVSLLMGSTDFTATAGEFLSGPPRIAGHWSDLSPNVGGTVNWSSACGNTTVSFNGLPEWGVMNPPTASFDVTFWSNGDVSIDNRTIGAGWSTDTVTGFSPGGGATGSAVTFSSLVGSSTTYPSGNAIFEAAMGASTSSYSSANLTPGNTVTVN